MTNQPKSMLNSNMIINSDNEDFRHCSCRLFGDQIDRDFQYLVIPAFGCILRIYLKKNKEKIK